MSSRAAEQGIPPNTHTCCSPPPDHLDYIKKVAGAGAVGFGGDYDGVSR